MIFNITEKLSRGDVTLKVFEEKFIDPLLNISVDQRIWQYTPEAFSDPLVFKEKWINKAIKQMENNKRICFVVFFEKEIAGSSSYYQIDLENKKLNIGYTWFHPKFWGSTVNPLTKLIMLEYAFEHLNCIRVEFSVDSLNLPSCKALKKLNISEEGVLRNHMILADGRIRDSVIYAVTNQEWPKIKRKIQEGLKLNQQG